MRKTALITGASSGIGLELARILASEGNNLVLVARNKSILDNLKAQIERESGVSVHTIGKDLSVTDSAQEVYDELKKEGIEVHYLINNAGFGDFGMFHESDWDKELRMINLNITTLTHFTKLFLRDMLVRKSGKIMNVASTAAFQPGPTMAVYYATKAYVLHFSEAVNNEVSDKGVTVTALCPGPTESGFQAASAMGESAMVKGKKLPSSRNVALFGYTSMMKGKPVAIHGFYNTLLANSVRFMPRDFIVRIARRMQDKVK